ncbi:hypothetical protein A8924_2818 [Saccharopolyspora erythraea NRRL 2338]|uniref:DUF2867 domain-containing protein n=1 Tax=Saccharopolyspora erythraea TaxID=1836 RepID=A0ABN1D5M8_SACER|nr:hypothetical protein A8924_2818 [Saccharopolyspora erythraea NRRL 2338]
MEGKKERKTRSEPDVRPADWELTSAAVTVDDFAAHADFRAVEHLLVDAPPEAAYPALRHLDLLTIRSRVAGMAMWLRGMPARLRRHRLPRQRTRLTFDDLVAGGDWALLGEQPGREAVFGAVGRFWTPIVRPEPVSAEEFAEYGRPRRGKIVMSVSVRPYGRGGSLMTYDVRTTLTDPLTRRVFGVYWRTAAPFVRTIMRATLRAAAERATAV